MPDLNVGKSQGERRLITLSLNARLSKIDFVGRRFSILELFSDTYNGSAFDNVLLLQIRFSVVMMSHSEK